MPALWFYMPMIFVLMLTGCADIPSQIDFAETGFGTLSALMTVSALVCAVLLFLIWHAALRLLHIVHLSRQDADRLAGR